MAAFALLPIISGLKFDLTSGLIGFDPKIPGDFSCLWSLGTGWGTLEKIEGCARINIIEGYLDVKCIDLPFVTPARAAVDGKTVPFTVEGGRIMISEVQARTLIEVWG